MIITELNKTEMGDRLQQNVAFIVAKSKISTVSLGKSFNKLIFKPAKQEKKKEKEKAFSFLEFI